MEQYQIFLVKHQNIIPISNPMEIKLDHFYGHTEVHIPCSTLNNIPLKLICSSNRTITKVRTTSTEFNNFIGFGVGNYRRYNELATNLANILDPIYNHYVLGDCYFVFERKIALGEFKGLLS
jgi:hypothetical protein